MSKRLETVDQVIDALGEGRTKGANNRIVAEWLGLNASAVCNWRERQSIPSGWHLRFYLEAQRRGMEIAPEVFGLPAHPVRKAAKKKRPAASRVAAVLRVA
jgi:hypothetical protein